MRCKFDRAIGSSSDRSLDTEFFKWGTYVVTLFIFAYTRNELFVRGDAFNISTIASSFSLRESLIPLLVLLLLILLKVIVSVSSLVRIVIMFTACTLRLLFRLATLSEEFEQLRVGGSDLEILAKWNHGLLIFVVRIILVQRFHPLLVSVYRSGSLINNVSEITRDYWDTDWRFMMWASRTTDHLHIRSTWTLEDLDRTRLMTLLEDFRLIALLSSDHVDLLLPGAISVSMIRFFNWTWV